MMVVRGQRVTLMRHCQMVYSTETQLALNCIGNKLFILFTAVAPVDILDPNVSLKTVNEVLREADTTISTTEPPKTSTSTPSTTTSSTTVAPTSTSTTVAPTTTSTTVAPTTTSSTVAPSTTSTTQAPSTTSSTTAAPPTSTTVAPPTSTVAPPVVTGPSEWYVKEGNVTCAIVKMLANVNISYTDKDKVCFR